MESRIKKPPINIKELGGGEEKPQRGTLSYVEEGKRPSTGGGKTNYTQIFISVVLSAILAFILITSMSASKKDTLTLLDNQGQLEARISGEVGRIDTIVNTMGEYAKRSELGDYASRSSVDSLVVLPAQIDSRFSELRAAYEARMAALEAKIVNLGKEIAALEVSENTTTEKGGGITLEMKGFYGDLYVELPDTTKPPVGGNTTVEKPFIPFSGEIGKLTITNSTGKVVEDIRIVVGVSLSGSLPIPYIAELSGGTSWTSSSPASSSMRFKSSRFKLGVGETKRIYLLLDINGTQPADKSYKKVYFDDVYAEMEDYSIM